MKDVKKLILAIVLIAGMLSCDVIDNPLKEGAVVNPPDSTVVLRKVVIEDFTGHRCKNCPDAAKQIKTLEGIYGSQIVGIAIHAGPSNFTGITNDYPTEFRTPEGNQIGVFFYGGISAIALPSGMVSRSGYNASHIKAHGSWPTAAANLVDEEAVFKLVQNVTYNAVDSTVTVNLEVTALAAMLSDLMVSVMVTENNIVAPQLMPDDTRNENYVHNHVLRTMFTPALGELLQASPIQPNQVITKTINGTFKPSKWVANNSDIVVYLFDADTQEILQAEVTRLVL